MNVVEFNKCKGFHGSQIDMILIYRYRYDMICYKLHSQQFSNQHNDL